jgi:FdhE protein
VYDCDVVDTVRPPRGPRHESREVAELQSLRAAQPELREAIDLQLEMIELYRRVQARVSVPWFELSAEQVARHSNEGRPLVPFEAVPIELTDLRLLVRQTAEAMHRYGVLDRPDYDRVQALGRDMGLLVAVGNWYRATSFQHVRAHGQAAPDDTDPALAQVFTLAMRPFLSRCAEVVQQRQELASWTCAHCAVCGGDPDLSTIGGSGERSLICGRCGLHWAFDAGTCPFCANRDRARHSSFATADGRYRVEGCDACRRYLKAYDVRKASRPVLPLVDAVATLALDAAAIQRGYLG